MPSKNTSAAMLLNHYTALEFASEEMLAAAQSGQWDNVARLEAACAVVIVRLQGLAEDISLDERQQRQRSRIMHAIMANELEICRICQKTPADSDDNCQPTLPASKLLH
ncbi:MAG: flagellar protein FliT [Pseudomonadota bacterium]